MIFLRSLIFNATFYVALILFLIVFSPVLLMPRIYAIRALQLWGRSANWLMTIICQIEIEVRGAENIPAGPLLVVSKHQSVWETFALPEGTRRAVGAEPDYKPGAAALYNALGVPCVAFGLNAGLFWPRRQFLRKPGKIVIEFSKPLPSGLPRKQFDKVMLDTIEGITNRLISEDRS